MFDILNMFDMLDIFYAMPAVVFYTTQILYLICLSTDILIFLSTSFVYPRTSDLSHPNIRYRTSFRMASADQDIGDELVTCTICLEHFTSPKTLVCLHTFCEACLRRHLMVYQTQRRGNLSTIPCPTCRELTPLPQMGVAGLRTDFKIAKIVDFLAQIAGKAKVISTFSRTTIR